MRNKLKVNRRQQLLTGIFVFLLFCSLSQALNPGKLSNEYQLDHWNSARGLPSNLIHSIAQTPDGFLWIATNKGLVRYDGINFSIITFAKQEEKASGQTAVPQALDYVEVCIKKLMHLVEIEKVYCDEKLTLRSLAEKLKIPYYQLSEILNKRLNRKFNDFINYYRIEEAKRILESSAAHDKTIVSVAFDVGFKSTTTFYQVFKKYTGMTPTQYKKEAHLRRLNQ